MSSTTALHRRLLRRETHSPKSALAIVLASLVILVSLWLGTELVIALLGLPALLVAPADIITNIPQLSDVIPGVLGAIGIVVAVVGVILLIASLTAGRRARHGITAERFAVVVDNEVIASALARHASAAASVSPDNTLVSVSHRRAEVRITPASGTPVDTAAVEAVTEQQIESYRLEPSIRSRVQVDATGRIGA